MGKVSGEEGQLLWSFISGGFSASVIHVGDKLGLYEAIHEKKTISCEDLAKDLNLNERWLKEWLMQSCAAKVLVYNEENDTYSIPKAMSELLLDPFHPDGTKSMVGVFQAFPAVCRGVVGLEQKMKNTESLANNKRLKTDDDDLENSKETERVYDSWGRDVAVGIERLHNLTFRNVLCNVILKRTEILNGELYAKLKAGGCVVADVGCGSAVSTIEMALEFPNSEFHGYELSKHAIQRAKELKKKYETEFNKQLPNFFIHDVLIEPFVSNQGKFDMVFCYDLLHDLSEPEKFILEVKTCLKPAQNEKKSCFVAIDVLCHEKDFSNIKESGAAARFGFSCGLCLHSGFGENQNGLGLGTMGLHPELLKGWADKYGFTKFKHFDLKELGTNWVYCMEN